MEQNKRKPVLHELLAVESGLQSQSETLIAETKKMFSGKHHLFQGKMRTLTMFNRTGENDTEIDAIEAKEKVVARPALSVAEQLNYTLVPFADYLNVLAAKDLANRVAKADLVMDGVTIATDVPGTVLLTMEQKLVKLRELVQAAPSLDPAIDWTVDVNSPLAGVYRSPESVTLKTAKEPKYITVAQQTDKHPAQVIQREETVNLGKYTDTQSSAMLPVLEKATFLDKIDRLIRACKAARQRANAQEAETSTLGDTLIKSVFGDLFDRTKTGLK